MKPVAVGLGEILWDLLPSGKKLGGAPANFAFHAGQLGARGAIVSCVGKDALGDEILHTLTQLDLSRDYVAVDTQHATGTVSVDLGDDGQPEYTIHEDVAWDNLPMMPALAALAAEADVVCFGSLAQRSHTSRSTIQAFLDSTRPDALRMFDVNLRQHFHSPEVIGASLEKANVFKLNDDELRVIGSQLSVTGTERDQLAGLADRFDLRLIALTRGVRGSLLYAGSVFSEHDGFPTEVADTVGAGDCFSATVALGLLKGWRLDDINERANRLAAFVCSQTGATPLIPDELLPHG